MKSIPIQKQLERMSRQRWSRRGIRTLLRAIWLGLSLCCLAIGAHILIGWPIDFARLQIVALASVALGALFLLRPRIPPREVARRIDQRYNLQEQMSTALEISAQGQTEGVAGYLIQQASHTAHQVQQNAKRKQRLPWAEMATLFALLLLAVGMLLLANIGGMNAIHGSAQPLPPLAGPRDPQQEFPMEPMNNPQGNQPEQDQSAQTQNEPPVSSNEQQALGILADALRDLSVTRPAAEALDRNDTDNAAQQLREVADQADQLSDETRRDLANSLQNAANEIGATEPELTEQLRDSSYGLQQSQQDAAQALDDLARAVEQLGDTEEETPPQEDEDQSQQEQNQPAQGQQNWQNQDQGQQEEQDPPPSEQRERPRNPFERLNVEGVPLELESGDTGDTPTSSDSDETPSNEEGNQFEQQTQQDDTRIQIGDDPLRIPADARDVVQEYFSPQQ